jgi:hypothetical protein
MRRVTTGGSDKRKHPARRLARVADGLLHSSTRPAYLAKVGDRIRSTLTPPRICVVCGSRSARTVAVRRDQADANARTLHVRICRVCGHVGNPENTFDYRTYEHLEDLTNAARTGRPERPGREFYMAQMAIDILGRDDLDVLIFGAGRSYDNHHIAALPQVRQVAIADVMKLRDDAEFIDLNLPAPRRFPVVVASEVVEHFEDPRPDFARLLAFAEPGGMVVLSTNLYDGGRLASQAYVFVPGHTSYYTTGSLTRLAEANGYLIDFRIPLVATGYAGPRKRYVLLSTSPAVMEATARYFSTHEYAPSESPTANRPTTQAPPPTVEAADAVRPPEPVGLTPGD